jgi:hypothetical protein
MLGFLQYHQSDDWPSACANDCASSHYQGGREHLPKWSSLSRLQDNFIVVTFITPEGQIAREKLTV